MKNSIVLKGKPVSVNDLYTGRRFLTKEGRSLKDAMKWEVKSQWRGGLLKGDLEVHIDLFYSDKRKRDIDNPTKAILDCLTGIVYEDDSQITSLVITKNIGTDGVNINVYERNI